KNGLAGHNGSQNGSHKELADGHLALSDATLSAVWERLIQYLTEKAPILANQLKPAATPAIFGPNALAIKLPVGYNYADSCSSERSVERIQDGLKAVTGRPIAVKFEQVAGPVPAAPRPADRPPAASDRRKDLMQ